MRSSVILFLLILIFSIPVKATPADTVAIPVHRDPNVNNVLYDVQNLISNQFYLAIVKNEEGKLFQKVIDYNVRSAINNVKNGFAAEAEKSLLNETIPLFSRYGDARSMYVCFMTLGKSYHDQKKFTEAKWFFIQSDMIAKKTKYVQGEMYSLIELAKVKRAVNDDTLALQDYKAAATLAAKINFKTTLGEIRKSMSSISADALAATKKADL